MALAGEIMRQAVGVWGFALSGWQADLCCTIDDAFVSIFRGLFNTRDRAQHTRKRKVSSSSRILGVPSAFQPLTSQLSYADRLAHLLTKVGGGV